MPKSLQLAMLATCLTLWDGSAVQAGDAALRFVQDVPFGVSLLPKVNGVTAGTQVELCLSTNSSIDLGPGQLHLRIPSGLELVGLDTLLAVYPRPDDRQQPKCFTLKGARPGVYVVSAVLEFGEAGGRHAVHEIQLPVQVSGDSIETGDYENVRMELWDGERGFRFQDNWMTPITLGEGFNAAEMDQMHSHARALSTTTARCPDCNLSAAGDTAVCTVAVTPQGTIAASAIRLLHGRLYDPASRELIVGAVRHVLGEIKYEAGRAHGRPVTDLVELKIPVSGN